MNPAAIAPLNVSAEELAILLDLLESARTKLLVEIRRTDHHAYRQELRQRLAQVEGLLARCHAA